MSNVEKVNFNGLYFVGAFVGDKMVRLVSKEGMSKKAAEEALKGYTEPYRAAGFSMQTYKVLTSEQVAKAGFI